MKRDVVDALIASLNDPNAGWKYDQYTATNCRIKCGIWLANGPDFMEVKFWGDKIGRQREYEERGIGGYFAPWRWRLYLTARRHQAAALHVPEVLDATIIAAIRSASEVQA